MNKIFSNLEKLALMVWRKPLYQHILFAIAAFISSFLMGYYFGTFDQASHIPFLKKTVDPTLYPQDHFFDLRNTHYSYFWLFFIPFYRLGILEISMFVVYVISIYLTFWALWRLTKTLFNNPLTSLLVTIVFIFPHIGFGMFPVIEFSLLNRTFVLPFLLLAIDFYLKRKFLIAFLILGVMYNLHVISVNFVLAMFIFNFFIEYKRIGWKKIILSILIFICFALPVLIWKFGSSQTDLSLRPEWFKVISDSIIYHLFNFISSDWKILVLTLGGLSSIAVYFIGRSHNRNQTIDRFVYAILIIIFIAFVTSQWFPVTIIIQSQIIRAGLFLIIFGYLFFTNYLVYLYQEGKLKEERRSLLFTSLFLSPTPLIAIVSWIIQKFWKNKLFLRLTIYMVIIIFVVIGVLAYQMRLWQPGINIYAQRDTNYDVQMWAKRSTPKNALFITPPYTWWFYNNEWRVLSDRSTVVVLSELLEAAFAPEYLDYWKPRFEDVAPGALSKFRGDYFENIEITKQAYYSLKKEDFLRLGKKYKASYLVVEKPYYYDLSIVYENSEYVIYELL